MNQKPLNIRASFEAGGSRLHELEVADERALEQLRTVQLLEETIGPRTIRQLGAVLSDRSSETLVRIEEDARRHRAVLEEVIREWAHLARPRREEAPAAEHHLSEQEILESFIELKQSQADVLRRAASAAPNDDLRERLEEVAAREEDTVERLRKLLGTAEASASDDATESE